MYGNAAIVLVLAALIGGCTEPPAAQAPEPQAPVTQTPQAADNTVATAEAFIDAFYSFDPAQLGPFFTDPALASVKAAESAPHLMYYQGWAEGGNYKVIERFPCVLAEADVVTCSITVQDDPVVALRTNFNVTDTFAITFEGGRIAAVDTSSNDQPVYHQARVWVVENMPEVMAGPCLGMSNGGPTPGDCARAMTEGYRRFAESDEYPL